MYSFCDTIEMPKVNPLPAEAVCFNGHWLDSEVPGFRTLAVEGRELISRTVDTYTVGNTDGANYRDATFGSRNITVTYQIKSRNQYEFRDAFNKLNGIIHAKQAQLIFADEQDKYFIATQSSYGQVPAGAKNVTGTIVFYCADPKKYAVKEKEVDASAESGQLLLSIRNDGNMPVPINYDISCASENGYIGIENGENYIRFGSAEDADGEEINVQEQLLHIEDFLNASDDPASGITNGAMKTAYADGMTWLGGLSNVGTGSSWHGAKRTLVVPPDKNGVSGSVNFSFYSFHWFQCAFTRQRGRQTIKFLDENDKEIIAFQISKENSTNAASVVRHYVNGQIRNTFKFEAGADRNTNPFFDGRGHNSVDKIGGNVRMYFWGKYYTYYDPDIENVAIKKVQFCVYAYGTAEYITRNYIGKLTFQKNDVDNWDDIQNRYSANDAIAVNGEEGKLYVNGMPKMGDEIKGSEYFQAKPGQNSVSVHCSDWATGINVKARIREAWI